MPFLVFPIAPVAYRRDGEDIVTYPSDGLLGV